MTWREQATSRTTSLGQALPTTWRTASLAMLRRVRLWRFFMLTRDVRRSLQSRRRRADRASSRDSRPMPSVARSLRRDVW